MEAIILNKAAELFLKYGFKSVTMDDIANDIGVSKKTIYVNYENKSDLVEATVNYLFKEIQKIIKDIENQQLNPIDESFKVHETVSQLLKDEKQSIEFQLKKYYPDIYNRINKTKTDLFQKSITDNLIKGINEGYYRKNIDIEYMGKFFLMVVSDLKNIENIDLDKDQLNYAMSQFFELYFRAIVNEKGLTILEQNLNKEN